jgi:hypothetical protein
VIETYYGKPMTVREQIDQLQFQAQAPLILYLNKDRVDTLFVARMGAIETFTREATDSVGGRLAASVGIPGLGISAAAERGGAQGANITFKLENPVAQALVLEAELTRNNQIHPIETAVRGSYVQASGYGCFRRPDSVPPGMSHDQVHRPWCIGEDDSQHVALERVRALQESDSQGRVYWLLVLQEKSGSVTAASVVDASWFDANAMASYLREHEPTRVFGLMERRVEGIPLISAMVVLLEPAETGSSSP